MGGTDQPPPRARPAREAGGAASLGRVLKHIVRREFGPRRVEGLRLARQVLQEKLGPLLSAHVKAVSVRMGAVVLEADASALFQELEGFRRQELLDALRGAGLPVRELRVRLPRPARGDTRERRTDEPARYRP